MHTNAGARTLMLEAEVAAFGKVYYDPDHIANIFGLAKMVDAADYVTFDSRIDDAFHVWKDDRQTIFARTPANLCACKPAAHCLEQLASSKNMLPPPADSDWALRRIESNERKCTATSVPGHAMYDTVLSVLLANY